MPKAKNPTTTEMKTRQMVFNAVTCKDCGHTIASFTTHDYQKCPCPNEAFVDGGLTYSRTGAKDMTKIETHRVYADEDFEYVRHYAHRGSRGKDGKQPLTWVPIDKMSDNYLVAVLEYGGPEWHLELITKELQYRYKNGLSISED